jgi:hypothetical protein
MQDSVDIVVTIGGKNKLPPTNAIANKGFSGLRNLVFVFSFVYLDREVHRNPYWP